MSNTIKIKRRPASGAAGKPSSLYNGELAFNENDNILYYGYGSGVGGAASSIEQIGGTGYFSVRGGTNASGLWPISVTGNAATVTDGVYTTGIQTITGAKTFSSAPTISGNLTGQLVFKSPFDNGDIIFDGRNLGSESSYIKSSTSALDIKHGTKIQLNSSVEVLATNTSGGSVGYFAVFDSDPSSSLTTLKSVSKSSILDDIGAATSGLDITAGSGLVGGGTLSQNRRFDIGQGDGITVSADSIAVDNTVVRTNGSYSDPSWLTISKTKVGLSNVTNDAQVKKTASTTVGYIPTWSVTTGDELGTGYSVETTLSGESSAIPRADAVKTYVDNAFAANDAMIFKGTIGTSGTITSLPSGTVNAGWTYRVTTAGTHAGVVCEVGDLIIAVADAAGNVNSTWTVAQTNIDGAVVSTRTLTAGNGLTGGGDLSSDRTFDVGQGDGISVTANAVAVDSTVVRTTGIQTVSGIKTFAGGYLHSGGLLVLDGGADNFITLDAVGFEFNSEESRLNLLDRIFSDGSNPLSLKLDHSATSGTYFSCFTSNPSGSVTPFLTRTASEVKGDIGLGNVENAALSTWAGTSNITTLGTIATGTWSATTIAVNKGGTGQTSYTDGQLLIGNTTGNTLTKATLTAGTSVDITNGNGSITIGHADTSTLSGAQGSGGIASITVDGLGHVTAVTTATYLTAGTVCAAIADCTLDGGSF